MIEVILRAAESEMSCNTEFSLE